MSQTTKVTITMVRRSGGLWEPGERALRYYDGEVTNSRWPTGCVFAAMTVLDVIREIQYSIQAPEMSLRRRNIIKEACREARETGKAEFEI
jgi:hypothetical protein